jgi:alpha-L-fucosidase
MAMTISIEQVKTSNLARFYPVEDAFLKNWFKGVVTAFETYGKVDLSRFENQAINYEFLQPTDYVNRIDFTGNSGAILTTRQMTVEYRHTRGAFTGNDIVVLMKRHRFSHKKNEA